MGKAGEEDGRTRVPRLGASEGDGRTQEVLRRRPRTGLGTTLM